MLEDAVMKQWIKDETSDWVIKQAIIIADDFNKLGCPLSATIIYELCNRLTAKNET